MESILDYRGKLQDARLRIADLEEVLADHHRLTKELDVAYNGDGAAEQASLCDIVAQIAKEKPREKIAMLEAKLSRIIEALGV